MTDQITDILKKLTPEDIEKLKTLSMIFGGGHNQLSCKEVTIYQGISEYEKYAEFNLEPKTVELIKTANRRLLEFFPRNRILFTIESKDGENLFIKNSKTAPSGAFNYNRVYRAMFNHFKRWNYTVNNPFEFKLPKRQKEDPIVMSSEQIDIVYKKLMEKGKPVIADMVLFAVDTGLRISEEANLRWSDIDLRNKVITIGSKFFRTKSKKIRKIPFNNRMEEILLRNSKRQLENGKILREFVFTQKNGKPWNTDTVSKAFKKECREITVYLKNSTGTVLDQRLRAIW